MEFTWLPLKVQYFKYSMVMISTELYGAVKMMGGGYLCTRTFTVVLLGMKERHRLSLQDKLVDVIMRVLVRHPELHYYQVKVQSFFVFFFLVSLFRLCLLCILLFSIFTKFVTQLTGLFHAFGKDYEFFRIRMPAIRHDKLIAPLR